MCDWYKDVDPLQDVAGYVVKKLRERGLFYIVAESEGMHWSVSDSSEAVWSYLDTGDNSVFGLGRIIYEEVF